LEWHTQLAGVKQLPIAYCKAYRILALVKTPATTAYRFCLS